MTLQPTPEQERIIAITEGCHLVLAPPGSGKTAVLAWRAARLLCGEPQATWRILALTFTTKAAQSLRARIEAEVRADGVELHQRLHASTIHSFCLDVLQHYGQLIDFPVPVSVYDETDRLAALRRAIADEALPLRDEPALRRLLHEISKAKRALTTPDATWTDEDAAAFAAYDRTLSRYGACDYDDLLRSAWRLFEEQPRVARHYRRMYRHLLVDEGQDVSRAQYMVLRALCAGEHRNVMLVADDRQAIYGFSGASTEYLERFVEEFGATRHTLRGNFRSARAVVDVANRLAQAMPGPQPPQMIAAGSARGRVQFVTCDNECDEARRVVAWVDDLVTHGLAHDLLEPGEAGGLMWQDIALLGRSRRNLTHVCRELARRSWPFLYSEGGGAAFEHPLVQLVVRGLRLVQNPRDDVTRAQLAQEWNGSGDLWADLRARNDGAGRIAARLVGARSDDDPTELLGDLLADLDDETRSLAEEGEALAVDVDALREIVNAWKGRTAGNLRSLSSFLAELSAAGRTRLDRPGVRVLTIHAAKGLEFRAVAVLGWDDGSLPDFRAVSEAQRREEHRIAYVAVTRAARDLLLTWPQVRSTRFGPRLQSPSAFLRTMQLGS